MFFFIITILLIAGAYDLYHGKIPNILSIAILALGFTHLGIPNGLIGIVHSTIGTFVGLALLIIPYALGGMAAGDVKLMGAVGAALGPDGVLIAFLYSAIAGGVYALLLILAGKTGDLPRRLKNTVVAFWLTRRWSYEQAKDPSTNATLCYGVAIAAGTIFYIVLELSGHDQFISF